LHFIDAVPGHKHGDFSDTEKGFPLEFADILSTPSKLPGLQALSVEFDLRYDKYVEKSYEDWSIVFYTFSIEESKDDIATTEANEGWRALMAKTFNAVAQNAFLKNLRLGT
jgi:hypothetical protein